MIRRITSNDPGRQDAVSSTVIKEEIQTLKDWIKQGAKRGSIGPTYLYKNLKCQNQKHLLWFDSGKEKLTAQK